MNKKINKPVEMLKYNVIKFSSFFFVFLFNYPTFMYILSKSIKY